MTIRRGAGMRPSCTHPALSARTMTGRFRPIRLGNRRAPVGPADLALELCRKREQRRLVVRAADELNGQRQPRPRSAPTGPRRPADRSGSRSFGQGTVDDIPFSVQVGPRPSQRPSSKAGQLVTGVIRTSKRSKIPVHPVADRRFLPARPFQHRRGQQPSRAHPAAGAPLQPLGMGERRRVLRRRP